MLCRGVAVLVMGWWRLTQPSSLLLYPGLRVLDFLCGPLILVLVLMAGNSQRMPKGLASFLFIRITVKNLALLGAFVPILWLVFATRNLYQNAKLRDIGIDFASVFQACSLGTLAVRVFSVTSVSGTFGFGDVIRFWTSSILLLCMSRIGARVLGNIVAGRNH